jgi:hypothetical protein
MTELFGGLPEIPETESRTRKPATRLQQSRDRAEPPRNPGRSKMGTAGDNHVRPAAAGQPEEAADKRGKVVLTRHEQRRSGVRSALAFHREGRMPDAITLGLAGRTPA